MCLEQGASTFKGTALYRHMLSTYYECAGLSTSQTMWTRRKEEAQQAKSEWEGLTLQLFHQTKGLQGSFPPGQSSLHWGRLAHDASHVWGEGLRAVHQLHDLQRLQLWHLAQQGTQQGLWATQQTQNQSSAWGASKLPSPTRLAFRSFPKVSWGGFLRRANRAIYQKQKPWWNYGTSLQSSCHKDREKKILCRKERCYGRADTRCGPQINSYRHQW